MYFTGTKLFQLVTSIPLIKPRCETPCVCTIATDKNLLKLTWHLLIKINDNGLQIPISFRHEFQKSEKCHLRQQSGCKRGAVQEQRSVQHVYYSVGYVMAVYQLGPQPSFYKGCARPVTRMLQLNTKIGLLGKTK